MSLRFLKILIIVIVYIALSSVNNKLVAQYSAYDFVRNKSAWITGENPTGIHVLDTVKMAYAELGINMQYGNFVNYYESDNSFEYGALCESFYRLSPKTTVYGKVAYNGFVGDNMGGSTVVNPYNNPFDIVEYSDTTAGTKYRDTYLLEGRLSTVLTSRLLLGLHAAYRNVSYFKTRDLRHTNDLMDLKVSSGLQYNLRKVQLGLMYSYRRSTEGVSYQSVGNKDQQFNSLINYGAFMGIQERFGENGYTEANDTKPFFDEYHSVGVQLMLFPDSRFTFYNELSASIRSGYFGKNASTSVVYSRHGSDIGHYKGMIAFNNGSSLHQLRLQCDYENLENAVNVYKVVTSPGGNTVVEYYGENKVLSRVVVEPELSYQVYVNIKNDVPEWILKAGLSARLTQSTTTVYPVYRRQTMRVFTFRAAAGHNTVVRNNIYNWFLETGYGAGSGVEAHDGIYDSTSATSVVSLDSYLHREFDYLTARRVNAGAGFRFTHTMKQPLKLYAELSYRHTQAFGVRYTGTTLNGFGLKFGCEF